MCTAITERGPPDECAPVVLHASKECAMHWWETGKGAQVEGAPEKGGNWGPLGTIMGFLAAPEGSRAAFVPTRA